MAKKAKRRGRPPGSKNKKTSRGTIVKNVSKMEVGQLRAHIDNLQKTLATKVEQQRRYLEGQLAGLHAFGLNKSADGVRTGKATARSGVRRKAEPKYQSKREKKLKWSGRGMTPVWMREEMRGTKFSKDDFLIK